MELSHSASFTRLEVLQIEAAYQIVITPDVFAHQVNLETRNTSLTALILKRHVIRSVLTGPFTRRSPIQVLERTATDSMGKK